MTALLVIGLGNPGSEYERTRHNVGARAVEVLASRGHLTFSAQRKAKARVATTEMHETHVVLAIPMTFMNESGLAAAPLVRHYLSDETPPLSRLVVIHDELDLAPGTVRIKLGGGTAGHNGLRSIGSHLHELDFGRIRIGVGKPPVAMSGADYVLGRVSRDEQTILDESCQRAADAFEMIVEEGISRAMTHFNAR
ncbi:MAG TPA: aminoacyl-tRNA hydrolase [Acidimicrobiales bacterium]|nr:aminoacyl-tRNA hydrolase [Acidimicrobiales bacterium]